MRTVKYLGPYPRVEYKGQQFKRGEATETKIEGELPSDFEIIDGWITKAKYANLEDLAKIKGIGKKTLEDIKRIYPYLATLKMALKDNKVSLRDDIVEILRKELLDQEKEGDING